MASNVQGKTLLVAAFDFGTTYSGYAFSLRDDPNKIQTNSNWYAGGGASRLASLKTPTSVLLNQKGEFHSFGFEAEDYYTYLAEDEAHEDWRLFRRFKMVLHSNEHLTKDVTVEDVCGKQMEAFPLFVMSIKYLQEHLLKAVVNQNIGIEETDIVYVLTIPAIWDDNAKRFMRDAAVAAGIESSHLKLALEPECASIWCKTLNTDTKEDVTVQGAQYMVVDLGGGTADISAHERKPDGSLKEIHKASGGPWGGIYVDENYMNMLKEIFGDKAFTDLRKTEMSDYFDISREFEHKKRSFDPNKIKQITVRMSATLRELAEKYSSKSLEERIGSLHVRENAITTRGKDKLRIDSTIVQSWFKKPIDLLIQHIKSLLAEPKMKNIQTVILVGGFGESPYVQERMRNEIPGIKLIVPACAGLAVLKGAVRFGQNPAIVSSRLMKYTYGTAVFGYFDEKKHPKEKQVRLNGKWRVPNCFSVYVRVNEEVRVDQQVTRKSIPTSEISHTPVYRTTQENPEYTTDPGCELLGTIELENRKDIPLEQQIIENTFMFGDTELIFKKTNNGKVSYMTFQCFK